MPEFKQEMATTRRTLEQVPDEKFEWKPQEKSSSLGGLATHLANIPSWITHTFEKTELDVAPPGAPPFRLDQAKSTADLLARSTRTLRRRGRDWPPRATKAGLESGRCCGDEPYDSSSCPTRRVSASA